MCERERERGEGWRERDSVCVRERERKGMERERDSVCARERVKGRCVRVCE